MKEKSVNIVLSDSESYSFFVFPLLTCFTCLTVSWLNRILLVSSLVLTGYCKQILSANHFQWVWPQRTKDQEDRSKTIMQQGNLNLRLTIANSGACLVCFYYHTKPQMKPEISQRNTTWGQDLFFNPLCHSNISSSKAKRRKHYCNYLYLPLSLW